MEKHENFIAKVDFQHIGINNFNRQQLAEITKKSLDEKIELRVGQELTIFKTKLKISEIVFTLTDSFNPIQRKIDIFSDFDNSETNCTITVFLEEAH